MPASSANKSSDGESPGGPQAQRTTVKVLMVANAKGDEKRIVRGARRETVKLGLAPIDIGSMGWRLARRARHKHLRLVAAI